MFMLIFCESNQIDNTKDTFVACWNVRFLFKRENWMSKLKSFLYYIGVREKSALGIVHALEVYQMGKPDMQIEIC